jgi:hypothetical protein
VRSSIGSATALAACLVLLSVLGSAPAVAQGGGAATITAAGRIGDVRIDHSDRAAIVAYAGEPEADESVASEPGADGWEGLGYRCSPVYTRTPFVASAGATGPYCRTVFYLSPKTGRLATFFTSMPNFVDGHGVSVGTRTAKAARLEHAPAVAGCGEGIRLTTPSTYFHVVIGGGHFHQHGHQLLIRGGRVTAFVLHSRGNDVGNFDCL